MSEEEVNAGLREHAAERKRNALAKIQTLDLSQTTWPELPHPRVVGAITYIARRGMYRYPHLSGSELRRTLAERHGVPPEPADPRQRRRRAAERGHPGADRARPAAADAVALLPAVPADGPPRPRAPGAGRGRRRRAAGRRPGARREGDRAGEPQRPHRRAAGDRRAAPAARGPAPGGGGAARRGARRLRRRPAAWTPRWRCSRSSPSCSCSAASPRPGAWRGCGSATRSGAPAPRSCWPSSTPTSASRRSPRPAPWRRSARPPS